MSIANRIATLRGQKTLNEFARETHTSPQNIHRYERGRMPSADFLASLASQGININWILNGEGPMYEKKNAKSEMLLASELEKLPEEFRDALRIAIQQADHPPRTNRKLHLAIWCQQVLRKAQDEIDRLFGI